MTDPKPTQTDETSGVPPSGGIGRESDLLALSQEELVDRNARSSSEAVGQSIASPGPRVEEVSIGIRD